MSRSRQGTKGGRTTEPKTSVHQLINLNNRHQHRQHNQQHHHTHRQNQRRLQQAREKQRPALKLLRLALRAEDSPWAHLLQSVSATLPPLKGDEEEAVARLAAEGPPGEQVGLAPYTPPQFMPDPAGGPR